MVSDPVFRWEFLRVLSFFFRGWRGGGLARSELGMMLADKYNDVELLFCEMMSAPSPLFCDDLSSFSSLKVLFVLLVFSVKESMPVRLRGTTESSQVML